ncbi:MAG: polysaccharide biosynthesis C-terminal domain-containing protein [bacterium]
MRQSTKSTFSDLIRYIPSVVIPSFLGFIGVTLYTRLLSPDEYGLYSLIFTTVIFVETFSFSWLDQSSLRYYERYKKDNVQTYFSSCLSGFLSIASGVSIAWLVILRVFANYFDLRFWKLLFLGPVVIFFDSGSNLMYTLLRAQRESLRYSFQKSIDALIRLLCGVGLIYFFGFGAEGILLGITAAGAFVFTIELFRLSKSWRPHLRYCNRDILKSFALYGLPIVGFAGGNIILSSSDRYFINFFHGPSAVGVYSAGYRFTETSVFLFISFLMLASFPVLIKTFEQEGELETKALMKDLLSCFLVLMLPIVFGISTLSRDIVKVVMGGKYLDAYLIIPWVSAGIFFEGLGLYFNKSFELKEKNLKLLYLLIVASLVNILLNFLLIPSLGNKGAGVATCAAYFVSLLLSVKFGRKLIAWEFPWGIGSRAIIACCIMSLVIYFLPGLKWNALSLVYKICIGFFVYVFSISILERRILMLANTLIPRKMRTRRVMSEG